MKDARRGSLPFDLPPVLATGGAVALALSALALFLMGCAALTAYLPYTAAVLLLLILSLTGGLATAVFTFICALPVGRAFSAALTANRLEELLSHQSISDDLVTLKLLEGEEDAYRTLTPSALAALPADVVRRMVCYAAVQALAFLLKRDWPQFPLYHSLMHTGGRADALSRLSRALIRHLCPDVRPNTLEIMGSVLQTLLRHWYWQDRESDRAIKQGVTSSSLRYVVDMWGLHLLVRRPGSAVGSVLRILLSSVLIDARSKGYAVLGRRLALALMTLTLSPLLCSFLGVLLVQLIVLSREGGSDDIQSTEQR